MTETNETTETEDKSKLRLSRPGKLEMKRTVETGQVRQSFSHGRSKAVTVEVRRKRTLVQTAEGGMAELRARMIPEAEEAEAPPTARTAPPVVEEEAPRDEGRRSAVLRTLTEEERAARTRALHDARKAETEAALLEKEEARRRQIEEAREAEQRSEDEARRHTEEEARRAEEEARHRIEEEAVRRGEEQAERLEQRTREAETATEAAPVAAAPAVAAEEEDEAERTKRAGRPDQRRTPARRGEPRRRSGKLTIAQALDDEERMRSLASVRRARERERRAQMKMADHGKVVRDVVVPETITVTELANRMAERGADVVKALIRMGVMASLSQAIDADTAELVVSEFGHKFRRVSEADVEIGLRGEEDRGEHLQPRPPIVTVMGHVDHGKTSLLDALRKTNVVAGEAGGITQHIGAYQVALPSGGKITFIDTPGHEAFTAMRARGANVTDIVVLVVAADDGIMPQTVEAIDHAKAAGVPIIVAINKIDRPDADPARVRNALLQHELVLEEFGGDVLAVEVSATEGTNLDKLEEAILLQAEVLELTANPERSADGVVVESQLDRGRGPVATLLVQRGTLNLGDIVVAGGEFGRVRSMLDEAGERIEAAGPAVPVVILGLNGVPAAGDEFVVVDTEARAREITEFRQRRDRTARTALAPRGTLEELFSQIGSGQLSELNLVVKGDVQGSVEAILSSAHKIGTDEVAVRMLHSGVGGINESDIQLAKASGALVVGFNVRANPQARALAEAEKVDIRYYAIIYDLIDDLKTMLSGMLAPALRETMLGNARILEVFNITKVGKVAGCRVTDGVVRRGAKVRLLRDEVVIHEGTLSTLKRFKDEVREVREGFECGMAFENYQDIRQDDVIECFEVEQVARTL